MRTPTWKIVASVAAAVALGGGAAAALPLAPGASSAIVEPVEGADVLAVQYRGGGFPVWALGPIPSGFGGETRTGRPFIAGRSYHVRSYRSYRRNGSYGRRAHYRK